jgi:hypothetical protein
MSAKDIYIYFSYLSSLSVLVPIIIGLFKFSAFNKQLKALFAYLLLNLVNDFIGYLLFINNISTAFSFEIFAIIQGFIVVYIYSERFKFSFRTMLILQLIMLSLFLFIHFISPPSLDFSNALVDLIICFFGVRYFTQIFINLQIPVLTNYYFFWINTAFLFYFGTTFLFSLFENFIRSGSETLAIFIWSIQLISNIIHNFLLSIGIWKIRKT